MMVDMRRRPFSARHLRLVPAPVVHRETWAIVVATVILLCLGASWVAATEVPEGWTGAEATE